jgi:deoxycytidylate deaminase
MTTAKKILQEKSHLPKGKSTLDKVNNTLTDELIIGICSPIGSLHEPVMNCLKQQLTENYKYDVEVLKISDYITDLYPEKLKEEPAKTRSYSELMHKIKGGDCLRNDYKSNSILIDLAIKKIRTDRGGSDTTGFKSRRKCYIINSLKNIQELKLLRIIYRDLFYLFGIFSPEDIRIDNLINQKGLSKPEADEIILKDEYENFDHGQNVRDTFVESDFFIRNTNQGIDESLQNKIQRYLHLIFKSKIITPNNHEIAMFHAKSAAGNSACLSRQVGAAITDEKGHVISRGWNDVPKFGGNLYRDGDTFDNRCKETGYCSNVKQREEIIEDISDGLQSSLVDLFKENNIKIDISVINLIKKKNISVLKSSRINNLIEFSRSIHAEMHAIIIGSQLSGDKMTNGSLYCTTYPCHNCARHIILAGIKKIYYIEPYKKSLCTVLHDDAITEKETENNKVKILLYDGVSPRRFIEFFSMNGDIRKDGEGNVNNKKTEDAVPFNRLSLRAIPELENQAVHFLYESKLLDIEDEKESK